MRKAIVVVGGINTDLVVRVERIPLAGQTLAGREFQTDQGGKGANQAVAVARLGWPVKLVGKVGSDAFGAASLAELARTGVDVSRVAVEPGASGVATIAVADDGENCIVVVPGANGAVTPEFVEGERETIRGAAIVLAQLEIPLDAVMRLAAICQEERVPLMLDPAPAGPLPKALPAMCTWLTPNETEARFYVGDAMDPAAALLGMGVRRLVLKRGARGVLLASSSGERTEILSFAVEAVDTVAAGDCYNGAFAVGLATGKSAEESARFAAAAAAISVTRAGAQASMPTLDEVEAFLQSRTA